MERQICRLFLLSGAHGGACADIWACIKKYPGNFPKNNQKEGHNMIFDTHAHYDDEAFQEDRDELLNSLNTHGIEAVVNVGASIQTTKNTLELMKKYPFVYGAVGVHPSETEELNDYLMDWLKHVSGEKKVVAIGEIGLDYYWKEPDPEIQKHWFVRQLQLAREVKLPVIIHSRDAARDTLDIMKAEKAGEIGGVIHCFSYGTEMAREYLNMGFYLGIGGVVTFNNGRKLKEVVDYMPLDRIVLETDCPYLSPVPNRGKRNSSLNLPYVAEAIGQIKGISPEEVIAITNQNARNLYRL
jgi:TatD DNase family protein